MTNMEKRMSFFKGQYPKGGRRVIEERQGDIRFTVRGANQNIGIR